MNKRNRIMEIFYRFMSGEHMAVKDLAAEYEVSEKSIQRDISEIKILWQNTDILWAGKK